jgi:hypothetical protein
MTYHPLANDTGGTADDRRAEASRIIRIIFNSVDVDSVTPKEKTFIFQMDEGGEVTPKQLFWLRDIKDKYL